MINKGGIARQSQAGEPTVERDGVEPVPGLILELFGEGTQS